MKFVIQVREFNTDTLVREIGPYQSLRLAEKAEDGLTRQLDHDRFYSDVIEKQDAEGN
jgi:uncharacterized FlaG/YvyC family protein